MPKVKRGHAEGTKGPEETKGSKRKRNEKKPPRGNMQRASPM